MVIRTNKNNNNYTHATNHTLGIASSQLPYIQIGALNRAEDGTGGIVKY